MKQKIEQFEYVVVKHYEINIPNTIKINSRLNAMWAPTLIS
jgi:hypothetical protein